MRILGKITISLLLLVSPCFAQRATFYGQNVPAATANQFPPWTWVQDTFDGTNQTTNGSCAAGTKCTISLVNSTLSRKTAWTMYALTTNNVTISRVCTNDSTCSSTNDNWQICGSSCQQFQSPNNLAAAYNVNGTVSSSSFTVVLSGASGTSFLILIVEMAPPVGFLPAFDGVAKASSGGVNCTVCTLSAPTVTGTDAVVHWPINTGAISSWNGASSPYIQDWNGPIIGFAITSSTAPTLTQASGAMIDVGISYTTTVAFTADSRNSFFTMANATLVGSGLTKSCSASGCTLTIPSTTAGNLIYIHQLDTGGTLISSVTDAGGDTFTVPSGCVITVTGTSETQSCAYTLSVSGAQTSVTVKTSGTSGTNAFAIYEVHRTSGSWVLDSIGSQQNGHSSTPPGVSLTLTGVNGDVVFQGLWCDGGANGATYYYIGFNNVNGGQGPSVGGSGSPNSVAAINVANSFPNMTWFYGSSVTNTAGIGVAFR